MWYNILKLNALRCKFRFAVKNSDFAGKNRNVAVKSDFAVQYVKTYSFDLHVSFLPNVTGNLHIRCLSGITLPDADTELFVIRLDFIQEDLYGVRA